MRTTLIIIQAAALTLFAVIGAYGHTDEAGACPVSVAQADRDCGE